MIRCRSVADVVLCALLVCWLAAPVAAQRQALRTQVAAPAGAQLIGRLPGSQRLNLAVSLPLRNEDQLDALLQQLYDPTSPNYRRFLTVQQFTEQYAPTVVDYQRVIGFAQSHGLKVTHTFANRLVVDVSGTAANVERAFQVTLQVYQHPTENRTFYAPDVEPSVEAGLPVLSVEGLSTFSLPHPMLKRASPAEGVLGNTTGSGQGGQFLGSDMRAAYGGGTALNGSGQVVGLIELGPYRLGDVISYFTSLGQPLNVPIVNVLVGVTGVCGVGCNDGEEAIDIQQAIAMAPGLSALLVYETNGPSTDALSAYSQAASDNIAKQLSISFGWGGTPGTESGYEQVFKELAVQGTSSFVASGDAGASLSGGYPGNSPYITDAGGTDLTTAGAGGAWQSETGWIGSGGGWNTQSPIPTTPTYTWDQVPAINTSNGGDASYRNIPDVSAEANTDNYFCANGSCQGGIGGTSLAAPRWAAFMALINQQAVANATTAGANPTFGFLNPTIYTLSSGNYSNGFHDITTGNNATSTTCTVGTPGCLSTGFVGFDAVTGFDLVTGWGSPNGPTAFNALAPTSSNPNFSMSATPSTLPLTAGNGGNSSIAVTALNGFNAATSLAVVIPGTGSPSYAPPGLTANLASASIPAGGGPVSLMVGTTSQTPGGSYVIAVVGTSGSLTQTAYVTVALPAFVGISVSPSAGVVLNQGGTATATITITGINGFNGSSVNLSATGLPSGVTASFTPVNSTTTTLTLSATNTVALTLASQPSAVTITGSAAGSTQSTVLKVFVNPPLTGGAGTRVDLSSAYNVYSFYTDADESAITASHSLDGVGFAFSANLLGSGLDLKGTQFTFGQPNQANAVSGTGSAIALPAGSYATLQLLATGIEGNQTSQTVTVTYTDSTTSQFTQSFSDWCSALNGGGCVSSGGNSGESVAVAMPYRDSAGGPDNRVFYLYGYSFALNTSKVVQSLTLPNNRDVIVLAASLTAPAASYSLSAGTANPTSVNAGSSSTAMVTVTPANGYAGSVTLSCSISPVVSGSGAPTCSLTNPVSITAGAATSTLMFNTVAPGGAAAHQAASGRAVNVPTLSAPGPRSALYASWIISGLTLIGLGVGSHGSVKNSSHRRKLLGFALFWTILAGLIFLPACGGGSGGGGGGGGCSSAPSVPTGLAASSITSTGATLTWTASSVGSGCSVSGYTVYQNGASIATVASPSYNVTGLSGSTQYSFSVAASDSAGASAQATAINVTTLSSGTPSGTYTITITGKDAAGVTQSGNPATVTVTVN